MSEPVLFEIFEGDNPLFKLGQIVMTPAAQLEMAAADVTPFPFLVRHCKGDWGDVDPEDQGMNDAALKNGERLFSVYKLTAVQKIWVITEHDRSVTTLLLPSDY